MLDKHWTKVTKAENDVDKVRGPSVWLCSKSNGTCYFGLACWFGSFILQTQSQLELKHTL